MNLYNNRNLQNPRWYHPDIHEHPTSIARLFSKKHTKKSSSSNPKSPSPNIVKEDERKKSLTLTKRENVFQSRSHDKDFLEENGKKENIDLTRHDSKDDDELSQMSNKKTVIRRSIYAFDFTLPKKGAENKKVNSPEMKDQETFPDDFPHEKLSINSQKFESIISKSGETADMRKSLPNKPLKISIYSTGSERKRLEALKKKENVFLKKSEVKTNDINRQKPMHLRLHESDVKLAIKAIQKRNRRRKLSRDYERPSIDQPLSLRLRKSVHEAYQSGRIRGRTPSDKRLSESSQVSGYDDDFIFSDVNRKNVHLFEVQGNRDTLKTVNNIRYREKIYKAATRLAHDAPMYPDWAYHDENIEYLDFVTINVGGHIFKVFEEVLSSLPHTKLSSCLLNHNNIGIPFFDRDHICFSAVLNFYRTGQLHVPSDTCLTFFEEELEFWGVSEQFIEPCCWSEYDAVKVATNTLKKYAEDIDKDENFKNMDEKTCLNLRIKLYQIMTTGTGNIFARWISTICAVFILLSISVMLIATTAFGRIVITDSSPAIHYQLETLTKFLKRTKVKPEIAYAELLFSGFFLSELIFRLILCPNRLEFFSDTLNWIDLTATTTSLLSNIFSISESSGRFEAYMLLLKLPRIFRLFKLTAGLRSGMDAFTLTVRACANELKLVFFLLFIATSIFGALIFVVEMVNYQGVTEKGHITDIYLGMWTAFVSMTTVGYGDFVPHTTVGHLCGSIIIMCGIIICQFPVPIVLKNFAIYNNQASARFNHKKSLVVRCTDPESLADANIEERKALRRRRGERYSRIISQYKR